MEQYDVDGNGIISRMEAREIFDAEHNFKSDQRATLSHEMLEVIMEQFDVDGDGVVAGDEASEFHDYVLKFVRN